MNLNDDQIKILDSLYRDASKGLLTAPALNKYLKEKGYTGYTIKNIKEYLDSLETTQTSKSQYSKVSYVAEGQREQYQIDLVYMPSNWFNHNYKYLLTCVDVFSKKGDIIPLKDRNQDTVTDAFTKILSHMGIPKTIYSDQGSEFKNETFQNLLDKHKIQIIFALGHAPFVEVFNKTIKTKLIKYMSLHDTKNWSEFLPQVLEAYNNTKHSATGVAPNEVSSKNELQVAMKLRKHAKLGNYPDLGAGDQVRLPIVHKTHQGYKQQWTDDLHTVEKSYHNGVYMVDGDLYPRKELQLVKGNVIKLPEKSKQEKAAIHKQDKIGKAANNPFVKSLMNTKTPDYKAVEKLLESGRSKRPASAPSNYATFGGQVFRSTKTTKK